MGVTSNVASLIYPAQSTKMDSPINTPRSIYDAQLQGVPKATYITYISILQIEKKQNKAKHSVLRETCQSKSFRNVVIPAYFSQNISKDNGYTMEW